MGKCMACGQHMLKADGCTSVQLEFTREFTPDRRTETIFDKIRYGQETRYGGGPQPDRCHDCGVKLGEAHHPGCDWEECPRCHRQLIGCGCNDEGKFGDVLPACIPTTKGGKLS